MSFTAARESKRTRHTCRSCRDRKARFRYRGSVRADRHHTLCFECFRSERARQRARQLAEVQGASPPLPFGPPAASAAGLVGAAGRTLTEREIAHRRAMLAYSGRSRAVPGGA